MTIIARNIVTNPVRVEKIQKAKGHAREQQIERYIIGELARLKQKSNPEYVSQLRYEVKRELSRI